MVGSDATSMGNPELRRRPPVPRRALLFGVLGVIVLMTSIYGLSSWQQADDVEGGLQFVIPEGAADSLALPTIDSAIVIPTSIVFAEGDIAVVSIRNDDVVANRAGPWVIAAGQTYTMAFDEPGVYDYVCSVDAAESVTITVE